MQSELKVVDLGFVALTLTEKVLGKTKSLPI